MRKLFLRAALAVLGLCLALDAFAQEGQALSEPARKQLNVWMAERAELMVASHRLEDEVGEAWSNLKFSSPDVESLRKRYRDLQHELAQTEIELRKRTAQLPEVKEKARLLDGQKTKILELTRKINEMTAPKQ